jgi:peptidoglycan/LPS O-acetylase OafA/YrhL
VTEVSAPDSQGTEQTRGFHFPAMDGLRAIAALAVAFTHSAFISGFNIRNNAWGPYLARLDIGVAVFFVISGFLLYRPFVLARFRQTNGPNALPYLRRRFLRIFPAFWLVLTVVLLVDRFHGLSWNRPSFGGLVAHYTLTHIYFHNHVLGPVQQSWTLATELAFYLMLPVYAALMRRLGRRLPMQLWTELAGLAALYLVSVVFRIWAFYGPPPSFNGQYNTWLPARVDLFVLGMLLAVGSAWLQATKRQEPRFVRGPFFAPTCWLLALASFWYLSVGFGLNDGQNRGPGPNFSHPQQMWLQFFWGITGFFLVAPAVFGPQEKGLIRAFLKNRIVRWVGVISYGIYLWHEAVIDWYLRRTHVKVGEFHSSFPKMTAFMLFFTLLFAAISYYGLERPILRLKDRTVGSWFRPGRPPDTRR